MARFAERLPGPVRRPSWSPIGTNEVKRSGAAVPMSSPMACGGRGGSMRSGHSRLRTDMLPSGASSPEGLAAEVLQLMEHSWFGPKEATQRVANNLCTALSVHDSASSFGKQQRASWLPKVDKALQTSGHMPSLSQQASPDTDGSSHDGRVHGATAVGNNRPHAAASTRDQQQQQQQQVSSHLSAQPGELRPHSVAQTMPGVSQTTMQGPDIQSDYSASHQVDSQQPAESDTAELLGTWANRQRTFPWVREVDDSTAARRRESTSEAAPRESDAQSAGSSGMPPRPRSSSMHPPLEPMLEDQPSECGEASTSGPQPPAIQREDSVDAEEAAIREAAWRWRFGRRWTAEQAKQYDPDYANDRDSEEADWDDALGYLSACGPGVNLIARTSSELPNSQYGSLISQGSGLFSSFLDESSSQQQGPLRQAVEMDATKSIAAMTKKAQDLMQRQQEIQRAVDERWDNATAKGEAWVGHYLPPVQMDTWGRFPFVLVRVDNRAGSSRLIVRAKSNHTAEQLLAMVNREVSQIMGQHHLPPVSVFLLGTGTLEWSAARDRSINIQQGTMVPNPDSSVQTPADVARVTGALIRTTLPMNYYVAVNGERLL